MSVTSATELKHFFFHDNLTLALTAGLQETLQEMFHLSCDFESSLIVQNWHPVGHGTGTVDLNSDDQHGQLRIHFTERAALAMMNKLLGRAPMRVNEETLDCIGALTDIVYGRMRALLNSLGYKFAMAIPQMHYTANLRKADGNPTHLVIPFRLAGSTCFVEVLVYT